MDFNLQNQTPGPNLQMSGPSKKTTPIVLIITIFAAIILIAVFYWYTQELNKDYQSMTDYIPDDVDDKMMSNNMTETTDAGPEITFDQDTATDIQDDLNKTNLEEVDEQFMEIDKDLQNL